MNIKSSIFRHPLIFVFLLIAGGLFSIIGCTTKKKSPTRTKNVVFVSSFHDTHTWTENVKQALIDEFNSKGYRINLNCIYLNAKRITSPETRDKIYQANILSMKDSVDAIIASDLEATDEVLSFEQTHKSSIPVVFVSEFDSQRKIASPNVYGIIAEIGIRKTMETARKMFPSAKKAYVWADHSETGKFYTREAEKQLRAFESEIEIEYNIQAKDDLELLKKAAAVDTNSFIILCTWQQGDDLKYYDPGNLYPQLVKTAPVPVFSVVNNILDSGIVGGYTFSPVNNGSAAAQKVVQLWENRSTARLSLLPAVPTFNQKALTRWNVSSAQLPGDATILFGWKSYVTENRMWIEVISLILIMAGIIVFFFILQHRFEKKKQKEQKVLIEKYRSTLATVHQQNALMKEVRANFDLALDAGDITVWIYNIEGEFFTKLQGKEIPNGKFTVEKVGMYMDESERKKQRDLLNSLIDGSQESTFSTFKLTETSGEPRYFESRMLARKKNGKVEYIIGTRKDITEQMQQQELLQKEKEKAQLADKLKSAFLANMSHEIRTPLNAIVGFSDLLLSTDDPEEREQFSKIINVNNELLLGIINDILDLSKLESGVLKLYPEKFDIAQVYENAYVSLRKRCENPDVDFIYNTPYRSCIITTDKTRLLQVGTNFVTNAIKYTRKGHITMGYRCLDGGIEIFVEDTGTGIPEEKQHRVFGRFEKLDSYAQGNGLGLSICHAIMTLNKGKIGFTSTEGKGSRFWAWFPTPPEIVEN